MSHNAYRQGAGAPAKEGGDPVATQSPQGLGAQDPRSLREAVHQAIRSELEASDLEFVRVLEDLIGTLVDKGVIMMTDLPKPAQDKIASRGTMRSKLSDLRGIVGENEDLMLP